MATFGPFIKDDGKRLRFRNKGIRMEGSSSLVKRSPQFEDHFLGGFDSAATGSMYTVVIGNTTGTGTASVVASAPGGILRLACTAASTGASYASVATTGLAFRPDKLGVGEKITFEARIRTITGTAMDFSFGLHDLAGEATVPYVISATSTVGTGLPTDYAGFVYSATPTSGVLDLNGTTTNYFGVINSCADTDVIASTGVMNDLKFHIFKVEVNSSGDVTYFVDDVQVYKQLYVAATTGLTPTVPLCASFALGNTIAAVCSADIDYFHVGGALDLTA